MAFNYSKLPGSDDNQLSEKLENLRGKYTFFKPSSLIMPQPLVFSSGEVPTFLGALSSNFDFAFMRTYVSVANIKGNV